MFVERLTFTASIAMAGAAITILAQYSTVEILNEQLRLGMQGFIISAILSVTLVIMCGQWSSPEPPSGEKSPAQERLNWIGFAILWGFFGLSCLTFTGGMLAIMLNMWHFTITDAQGYAVGGVMLLVLLFGVSLSAQFRR